MRKNAETNWFNHVLCHYKECGDSKIHILIQSVKIFYQQILLAPRASNFQDLVAPEKSARWGQVGALLFQYLNLEESQNCFSLVAFLKLSKLLTKVLF